MTDYKPLALTPEAFRDFGEVLEVQDGAELQAAPGAFSSDGEAVRPRLFLLNLRPIPDRPFRIARLERHPHAAQTFLPLSSDVGIVIACGTSPTGGPALDTLRAFIALPGQVVTYRRGVRHHSAMAAKETATVAMAIVQVQAQDALDTEFFDMPAGLEIRIV
jgi:ureidoglycolate lyase